MSFVSSFLLNLFTFVSIINEPLVEIGFKISIPLGKPFALQPTVNERSYMKSKLMLKVTNQHTGRNSLSS